MPWDRSLELFVNVGTTPDYALFRSSTDLQPAARPVLVARNKFFLRLFFIGAPGSGGPLQPLALAADEVVILTARSGDGEKLLEVAGFAVGSGEVPFYQALANLNTQPLEAALAIEPSLLATVEVFIQAADAAESRSLQFQVKVLRSMIDDDDPPVAIVNRKRGSTALAQDAEAGAVVFDEPFAAVPGWIDAKIVMPDGLGAVIPVSTFAWSADGFSYRLQGPTPDAAHILKWIAER